MKVEVEFSEIESLKEKINYLERDRDDWKRNAEAYDSEALYEKCVKTSIRLFNDYMICVFKNLGFEDWDVNFRIEEIRHFLGEHWYDSERLDFNIGASMSKQWRTAFLSFGILTKKVSAKKDSEKKLDE